MLSAASRNALAVDAAPNPWFDPSYVTSNWDSIVGYLGEHVRLTAAAVLLGALIALPLALLARRSRWLAGPVLGLSTLIYTIPSLAMFAFVFPFTGLTATTVLIGLVLYTLVILVRNFLTGLQSVPADVREAARGMGYGAGRLLWQVELPLALPAFIAGLRVATVSTVALTTVGVIVGHGGLGQLIVGGFNANFYRAEIVTGAVGCVLLALLADLLLAGAERVLTPWARRARS
ncbi:ABC transporter permease [Blastococcus saxobsidens]|uniref:ABC-type proline/glycine betaine transport system, permease component n=1 Tax=Blastococcus saxobsidens (strain DD2) TaxID=1146883 RepID=H6RPX0_BLASD|nr:ABC transporter permease [Blastococcus saxobsidens]CCG01539.1 ABC-type proline/glycine betaine transport system, permease component [Blastococcus saxobsidens DD2]